MKMFEHRYPNYSEMLQRIGEEKFEERLKELRDSANKFIEEAGYQGHVECNERILLSVVLDYYADICRQKDFHEIKMIRTEKIFAYTIVWLIRRKPLQYIHNTDLEKDIYVNERFAAYLMLNECLLCGQEKIGAENRKELEEYINLLLYYFKYRECNAQVIELAIESFKMGRLVLR